MEILKKIKVKMEYQFTAQNIIDEGRTTQEAIDEIKKWIIESDDLPKSIPEQMIVVFLLSCNNEIEATKATVKAYFYCKKNGPEIHDNRDLHLPDVAKALRTVKMSSIPNRTKDNDVIHFFKLHDSKLSSFDLASLMKISYMLLDVSQEKNPPDGLIVVIDMKGFGLLHLTKFNYGLLKKYMQFLQEGMPLQIRSIHVLNSVYFFDKVLSILKMVMKSELIEMLKIHTPSVDMQAFFKEHVPIECMPKDYGGEAPSVDELHDRTLKQLDQ